MARAAMQTILRNPRITDIGVEKISPILSNFEDRGSGCNRELVTAVLGERLTEVYKKGRAETSAGQAYGNDLTKQL